jgi:hypothetical protein
MPKTPLRKAPHSLNTWRVLSFEEAVEVRTEFAKTAYETFVAESKRIVEMYAELSKSALKPFGGTIAKPPSQATVK